MTKKFWRDWQNRIGETLDIYVLDGRVFSNKFGRYYYNSLYLVYYDSTILEAKFHGDVVDLKIERHFPTKDRHLVSENEYLTLHRNDIKTVKFIKNKL